jgi:transcriptional regulator with XRE-family HTH domain
MGRKRAAFAEGVAEEEQRDAQVLRDIRDLRGETQQTLGRQLGWSVSAVSRFEATAERPDQATHQRLPILAFGLVLSVLWTVADAVVAVLGRWWRGWRRHWRRPF